MDLSPLVKEDEFDGVVVGFGGGHDLCRNPGMVLVFEPDTGAFAVYVLSHIYGEKAKTCPARREERRPVLSPVLLLG